jgi:hypothetical protein
MATRSNKTYHDPRTAGSLSSLLRSWQQLRASRHSPDPIRVSFTLSCWGESRATRVAGFLRRRRHCADTTVHQVAGAHRDTWHVHGSTYPSIASLSDLEQTWLWLRKVAQSHQVGVLRIRLLPIAA